MFFLMEQQLLTSPHPPSPLSLCEEISVRWEKGTNQVAVYPLSKIGYTGGMSAAFASHVDLIQPCQCRTTATTRFICTRSRGTVETEQQP